MQFGTNIQINSEDTKKRFINLKTCGTREQRHKDMNYTTTYINANYRIKVFGMNAEGKKINTLVGVSGLLNLIGTELANKLMDRREKCMDDACVCKLRRGLKVTFYVK